LWSFKSGLESGGGASLRSRPITESVRASFQKLTSKTNENNERKKFLKRSFGFKVAAEP